MRESLSTTAMVAVLLAWGLSGTSGAQEAVRSFEQLSTRLRVGETILVTDTKGSKTKGTILEIDTASLVVDSGSHQRTYGSNDVQAVERPAHAHSGKGAFWGTLAGFGLLAAGCQDCKGELRLILGGLGAGIGLGVGAFVGNAIRSPRQVVYRAAPSESTGVRLWVSPAVTRDSMGLVVSFRF